MATERHCCDGLCAQGRVCPAFAPGVITGYRQPLRKRLVLAWRELLAWLRAPSAF